MKTLNNFIKVPNMYNCVNSVLLVYNLIKQVTHNNCKFTMFDIKDTFVNIPTKETVRTTKYLVTLNNIIATL